MFAFTYLGGKFDHSVNSRSTPYIYRLNRENHHVIFSLILNEGDDRSLNVYGTGDY